MSNNPAEEPGQAPEACSSAAQPSAPPMSPEPAETSSPVQPDENTHEDDQKRNPNWLPDDKKDEIYRASDADISTSRNKEADDAFNRLSELLQDGEADEKREDYEEREDDEKDEYDKKVLDTIREIGNKQSEQLDRMIRFHGYSCVTALHFAIYRNLPKTFDALIEVRKSLLKATNSSLQIPLHIACWCGRPDMVEKLVELEPDINAQDTNLMTPLHWACSHGRLEIVKFLLGKEADISLTDDDGWTPFISAVANGHQNIAELLMEGSDINHKDNSGETPLHIAARNSDLLELMSWLIEKEADLSLQNNSGSTPLDLACWLGHDNIVSFLTGPELREHACIESRDNNGWTPLISASWYGHLEVVRLLLGADANTAAHTSDETGGWTALMTACGHGYKEIVTTLLKHPGQANAIFNQTDKDGDTPLHYAARYGQGDIVDTLLESNADAIQQENKDGDTPLHYAARYGQGDIVGTLLESNADAIQQENKDGDTPLHYAARYGQEDVFHILLKLKPEYSSKGNKDGYTPLHMACLGDPDAETNGGELQNENCDTVYQSSTTDESTDPHFRILESLLEKGANPSVKTKEDDTALHLVVKKRNFLWIAKIMEKVEPEIYSQKNKAKKTPLHIALDREIENDFFRAMNPDQARENRKDWSAVEWAAVEGHPSMLWELLVRSHRTSQTNNIQSALDHIKTEKRPQQSLETKPPKNIGGNAERDKKTSKGGKKINDGNGATDGKASQQQQLTKGRAEKEDDTRESNLGLIKGILTNPPIATSMPWEKLNPPEDPTGLPALKEMNADLLQFFVNKNSSAFLRRNASVKDVIYTEGPHKVMGLRGFLQDIKAESKCTWIHLPANNIKWMEDLTKRIWFDKKNERGEAKAKGGNPGSNRKGARGPKDDAAEATCNKPEPTVEGEKHGESGSVEDHHSLEDQFNTARWFFKTSWRELPEKKSEKKFMKPVCKRLEKGTENSEHPGDLVALYMPYLRFATEFNPEDTSDRGERVKDLCQLRDRHNKFLKDHEKEIVHGSRTLDEFYYQHLVTDVDSLRYMDESRQEKQEKFRKDLRKRNCNQVASRYFHGNNLEEKKLDHWGILRVDHLWLWIIDDKTIVTSSTHSFDGTKGPVLDSVIKFLSKQTEDPRSQASDTDAQQLSRVIVQLCCDFYNDAWREGKDGKVGKVGKDGTGGMESVRHIFSNTINHIAIREADLFQRYRNRAKEDGKVNKPADDANATDLSKTRQERANQIQDRQKISKKDIAEASDLFYEIKDTSDELNILLRLAKHQRNIQAKLCGDVAGNNCTAENAARGNCNAENAAKNDCKTGNIVEDIEDKISLANKIREAVETTLTLQQSELSILQNELSVLQNELSIHQNELSIRLGKSASSLAADTYKQGKTLMVFTIITIVFLPASFCSSLFALDVASFLQSPLWAYLTITAAFIITGSFSAVMYRKTLAKLLFPEKEEEPLSKGKGSTTENKPGGNSGGDTKPPVGKIPFPEGQEQDPLSKDKAGTAGNKAGGSSGGETKPPVNDSGEAFGADSWARILLKSAREAPRRLSNMFSLQGQEKEPSSKKEDGMTNNEAGGNSGEETKPPGNNRRHPPKANAEEYKGKEPVLTTESISNGANGHPVEEVGPRWRSWFKKLLRGGHAADRGPEVNV